MEVNRDVSSVEHESAAGTDFFANARKELPPNFALKELPKLLPGVVAVGTVHNSLSAKAGPPHQKLNGKVILERDSFLDWLQVRPRVAKRTGNIKDEAA